MASLVRHPSRPSVATSALLAGGVAAGPLYVAVGGLEMLFRPGFDPLRHDLSLMANGDFGWIHTSLLILTGLLVVASSLAMRSVMRAGPASAWGPWLVAVYGLGLIGAGFFAADPAFGFPPGTPADEHAVSWHGLLHLVSGAIGFVGFIAACFVIARRFSWRGRRGWATFSRVTGVVFAVAFIGIAAGSQQGGVVSAIVILAFTAAVVLAWAWLSLMQLQLTKEVAA
jgi:hypothetical protein